MRRRTSKAPKKKSYPVRSNKDKPLAKSKSRAEHQGKERFYERTPAKRFDPKLKRPKQRPQKKPTTNTEPGTRLDLYLKERCGSRKQAKRLLDEGKVRVNGRKVVIASWEIQPTDRVEIVDAPDAGMDLDPFFLKVVYEDEAVLVIEKDAGITCETSPQALKPSLVQIINAYLKRQQTPGQIGIPYLGLIHRLDTDTSGLMIYSKQKAANKLSAQFKQHTIGRRYQALVTGKIERDNGHISTYIAKDENAPGEKVRIVKQGAGKKANTEYRVLERYQDATLVELIPRTGRTHQLRVHLAWLGHPIWHDRIYGTHDPKYNWGIKRQVLHASTLEFHHPLSGKLMKFSSPLPRDIRQLVDKLRVRV